LATLPWSLTINTRSSKQQEYDTARQVFTEVHTKRMDWPEAIWEAWIAFEHLYGSVDDITSALDKIEKARTQLNNYRARVSMTRYALFAYLLIPRYEGDAKGL
jgi:hypothetical protein